MIPLKPAHNIPARHESTPHDRSQKVRMDMTTRVVAGGADASSGRGRGGGGDSNSSSNNNSNSNSNSSHSSSNNNNARGSGRVKDLKDTRDNRDRWRRDDGRGDGKSLRDSKDGGGGGGGGGGDKRERLGTEGEEQEAPPHKEWLDLVHDMVRQRSVR